MVITRRDKKGVTITKNIKLVETCIETYFVSSLDIFLHNILEELNVQLAYKTVH